MPKTVLIKASAFRLLDHFTALVGETLTATCSWLAVVPYCMGPGLGCCIYNLLPRRQKLNFPCEVSCSCSWVQHPPLPSSETQVNGNTLSSFTAPSTDLPSTKSGSKPLVQFSEICLAVAVINCQANFFHGEDLSQLWHSNFGKQKTCGNRKWAFPGIT